MKHVHSSMYQLECMHWSQVWNQLETRVCFGLAFGINYTACIGLVLVESTPQREEKHFLYLPSSTRVVCFNFHHWSSMVVLIGIGRQGELCTKTNSLSNYTGVVYWSVFDLAKDFILIHYISGSHKHSFNFVASSWLKLPIIGLPWIHDPIEQIVTKSS